MTCRDSRGRFWSDPARAGLYTLLLVLLAAAPLGMASCGEVPDASRVVARVNGKEITRGELLREAEKLHGGEVLLRLVDEQIIQGEATRRGITLSAEEQKAGLDRAAARVGSMKDLEAQLQSAGMPLEAYQRKVDLDLLLDRISLQEAKVTDAEVAAYYEEHKKEFTRGPRARARIMLFSDQASAEAVAEALSAPEADFAGLAKSLSEDGATASQGGDTGYFEEKDYAPAISQAAFELPVGATSGVLKGPDGWVIVRVEGRKPAGVVELAEVREQIQQLLTREKQEQIRGEWLVTARKAAEVKVRDHDLEAPLRALLEQTPLPALPGQL